MPVPSINPLRPIGIMLIGLLLLFGTLFSRGADWPQWRGPQRKGDTTESGLVAEWTYPPPIVWTASDVGDGYSSVAIADGRVFTLGRHGQDVACVALRESDGEQLWSQTIGKSRRNAMSTPTVHDGFVYVIDPEGKLVCLTAQTGAIAWQRDLVRDFGGHLMSARGFGESVLIDRNRLICTPGGADAMMVALSPKTGETIWQAKVPSIGEKGRDGASFSSVVVTEAAGRRQYVQLVGRGLIGIEASTGQFLWGYNDISNSMINIPTPIVRGEFVFHANGYNAGSVLLRLQSGGETGVVANEVYRLRGTEFQNHHGGVILLGDHIFGGHGSNNGLPTCLELATGRILWKRRGPGQGSAAVAAADGHLVFRYQNGVVAWIDGSSTEYRLRGTFDIPGAGGDSWSHPAIANGRLYLREQSTLWVHDLTRPGTANAAMNRARPENRVPPDFLALRGFGLRVEAMPTKFIAGTALSDRRQFYRYAVSDDSNENSRPVIVTISDDQLSADGRLSPDVLGALQRLSSPFVIDISESSLRDEGLIQLTGLTPLVGLTVELCEKLTDEGFKQFANAHLLRMLIATSTRIAEGGLKALASLPDLVALDLETCDQVTDAACHELAKISGLKALNLKKTAFEPQRISERGLVALSSLRQLEVLNVCANDVSDMSLTHFEALAKLQELNLSLVGITDEGLSHLVGLKQLQRLDLMYTEGFAGPTLTDRSINSLRQLPHLRRLVLTGAKLTDEGLIQLAESKQLRELELIKTQTTAEGVRRFQAVLPDCRLKTSSASLNSKD